MGAETDVLGLVTDLLEGLESNKVGYVHWKSNEHLLPALRGDTDLDLLVAEPNKIVFEKVLVDLGFVPLTPASIREIPGSESHLGFDPTTGTLVHLDVQYRLTLGEQLLKNHRLPVDDWLLGNAGDLHGVRVPQPERELLLLYVRTMLKTTTRQLMSSRVKGGSPVPQRIFKEAVWLAERVTPDSLRSAAESSGLDVTGEELIDFVKRVEERKLDLDYISDGRKSLRDRLSRYQRLPAHRALPKKMLLRLRSRPWARRLHIDIPKRRLANGGLLVAAVGADGSGKTRLSRDLEKWLEGKVQVEHVYFGQPKSGVFFKLLNKPGSLARKRGEQGGSSGALGTVARYTDSFKWLALGRKRRRAAREGRAAAREGVVVLAERYPLEEFFGMETPMDGPRLQPDRPFARAELRQYLAIEPPELTIVLKTSLQTLRDRKIDLTVEEHIPKVAAVEGLAENDRRVVIDAGQPYEEMLLAAQTAIWRSLSEGR